MAVTKRLRFEILNRDNHVCRYCGASAPDAVLTIDHVTPVALGGTDEPSNLVTACKDCNSGKSSMSPNATAVADVKETDLIWAAAIRRAQEIRETEAAPRRAYVERFEHLWAAWTHGHDRRPIPRASDWAESVARWYDAGVPAEKVAELIQVACGKEHIHPENTWRYFCGCVWTYLREIQETAKDLIAKGQIDNGS